MMLPISLLLSALTLSICLLSSHVSAQQATTSAAIDYLSILQQLNLHQQNIDEPFSAANAAQYVSLYWPEAVFTSYDLSVGETVSKGHPGIKQAYDYDHSVFPLDQWFHTLGLFNINVTNGTKAIVHWRWRVDWKANTTGILSTGTYDDVFKKRNGAWKVLERYSRVDPNWPTYLFAPYAAAGNLTFRES